MVQLGGVDLLLRLGFPLGLLLIISFLCFLLLSSLHITWPLRARRCRVCDHWRCWCWWRWWCHPKNVEFLKRLSHRKRWECWKRITECEGLVEEKGWEVEQERENERRERNRVGGWGVPFECSLELSWREERDGGVEI